MITATSLLRAGRPLDSTGKINLIAERKYPYRPNTFNDLLYVIYFHKNSWVEMSFPITTLPGNYYLSNLLNSKGTAILKEGHYKDAYKIGLHKGENALIQCAPVTVYRDKNRDENFDLIEPESGMFGINIHRAGKLSHFVNSWSAGCQVFKVEEDFNFVFALCRDSASRFGNRFSYTLIEEGNV